MSARALIWFMPEQAEQPSDDMVAAQVLAGDTRAFEILVRRHESHVFRLVKNHVPAADVEDTAQEAFVRAYRSLPTYQGRGRGFRAWLSSITVRACYDYWRRAYRSRETPISNLSVEHARWLDSALTQTAPEMLKNYGAAEQARHLLETGLARLSPEDRMVLELVYLEGLSGREAAELLGWSIANVKVRSFRARRKLEAFLLKRNRSQGV